MKHSCQSLCLVKAYYPFRNAEALKSEGPRRLGVYNKQHHVCAVPSNPSQKGKNAPIICKISSEQGGKEMHAVRGARSTQRRISAPTPMGRVSHPSLHHHPARKGFFLGHEFVTLHLLLIKNYNQNVNGAVMLPSHIPSPVGCDLLAAATR